MVNEGNLENRVSGIDINLDTLKCEFGGMKVSREELENPEYNRTTKFIAVYEKPENIIYIYIGKGRHKNGNNREHEKIATEDFGIDTSKIVGGGFIRVDYSTKELVLDEESVKHYSPPKEIVEKLAEKVTPELDKMRIPYKRIKANPKDSIFSASLRRSDISLSRVTS